jgi:uncharacterized protein (UPF0335 family)
VGRRKKQADIEDAIEAAPIGHNSALNKDEKKKLEGFVSEIVRAETEKKQIADDIKTLYVSAKDTGFSKKALRAVVRAKMMTDEQRRDAENLSDLVDTYKHALGMLADLPLGEAALARDLGPAAADVATQPFRDNGVDPRVATPDPAPAF